MNKPYKGESITIKAGESVYFVRTEQELAELYAADAAAGRYMDSAGEPIIHSRQGTMKLVVDTPALVIATKNVPWTAWHRKPTGLVMIRLESSDRYYLYAAK